MLQLNIMGIVGPVEVGATIHDSSLELDHTNKNSIDLKTDHWELYWGEYWANLSGSEFLSYNKHLDGVKGVYKDENLHISCMVSEAKGVSHFDKFYGQNSQGPYYTSFSPIIVRSEKIDYLGKRLVRNSDYTIDYEIGEITFKKEFIPDTDLFTIDYEYSDQLFKRNLVGFNVNYLATQNNKISFSYLNLTESGSSIESSTASVIKPKTHSMLGVTTQWSPFKTLRLKTDIALSQQQLTQDAPSIHFQNFAAKQGVEYQNDSTQLDASIKKIGHHFQPLGSSINQPGLLGHKINLRYTPVIFWDSSLGHMEEHYSKNDQEVKQSALDFDTNFHNTHYTYYKSKDKDLSNTEPYEKDRERQGIQVHSTLGIIDITPGYRIEKNTEIYRPETNHTNYSIQLGSRMTKIRNIRLASLVSLDKLKYENGAENERLIAGLDAGVSPIDTLSLDGSTKVIRDQQDGLSALGNADYAFSPFKPLKLNGNFELETLKETFQNTLYRLRKYRGNYKFHLSPIKGIKIKYRFKPLTYTIPELDHLIYEDRLVNQTSLDLSLIHHLNLGLDYKKTEKTFLDKTRIVEKIIDRESIAHSTLIQAQYQLSEKNHILLRYGNELEDRSDLATELTYENTHTQEQTSEIEYTYKMSSDLKVGSLFTQQENHLHYRLQKENDQATAQTTAGIFTDWTIDPKWWVKITTSGSKTMDLLGKTPHTYAVIPRLDFRYKPLNRLLFNGYLETTHSFIGQETRRNRCSLRSKYDIVSQDIHHISFAIQLDYENETAPHVYQTWDTLMSLNVVF